MTSIPATFNRLRREGRKAFIPFVMAGFPSLAATGQLIVALEDAGADLIEVGVPFSDPLSDGPIIQDASAHALAHGVTPPRVLDLLRSICRRVHVPLICLSYWNPLVQYGGGAPAESVRTFLRAARLRGVAGLIVPDLPVEEGQPLRAAASAEGVATIFLAAPTSPPDRLRAIARDSTGFIYYVSVTGTTGVRRAMPLALVDGVRRLKQLTAKPVCVGFGISTPAQAGRVARVADGVIVGSALIRAVKEARGTPAILQRVTRLARQLRAAI